MFDPKQQFLKQARETVKLSYCRSVPRLFKTGFHCALENKDGVVTPLTSSISSESFRKSHVGKCNPFLNKVRFILAQFRCNLLYSVNNLLK